MNWITAVKYLIIMQAEKFIQSDKIKKFIPGSYHRDCAEDVKWTDQTITITCESKTANAFRVAYSGRLRDSSSTEKSSFTWTGVYIESGRYLIDDEYDWMCIFIPEKNKMVTNGLEFIKVEI